MFSTRHVQEDVVRGHYSPHKQHKYFCAKIAREACETFCFNRRQKRVFFCFGIKGLHFPGRCCFRASTVKGFEGAGGVPSLLTSDILRVGADCPVVGRGWAVFWPQPQ